MEVRSVDDYLQCHYALDWLPGLLLMRVSHSTTARHVYNERIQQSTQHVLARLERRTATGPVAQTSTNSDHTRLIHTWLTPGMGNA